MTQSAAVSRLPSIYEAWEMFREERAISLSATSISTDYRQVSNWLKRCPVQDLQQGRQALIWVLQQKPLQSARRVAMFVRSLYQWASCEDVGLITRNPVANFKMPKAPQKNHEVVVIPKGEIQIILLALKSNQRHRAADWSLFAEFMLQTGMRTGEVRALKWTDIDDNRILVHGNYTLTHGYKSSTKTNKSRWVPLNERAIKIVSELPKESEYIFPWNRNSFQSFFREKAGELYLAGLIKHRYRPYDLRHVAISRWLEAGIPVAQCASWAGNTSEIIWKHYANSTAEYEMPVL